MLFRILALMNSGDGGVGTWDLLHIMNFSSNFFNSNFQIKFDCSKYLLLKSLPKIFLPSASSQGGDGGVGIYSKLKWMDLGHRGVNTSNLFCIRNFSSTCFKFNSNFQFFFNLIFSFFFFKIFALPKTSIFSMCCVIGWAGEGA